MRSGLFAAQLLALTVISGCAIQTSSPIPSPTTAPSLGTSASQTVESVPRAAASPMATPSASRTAPVGTIRPRPSQATGPLDIEKQVIPDRYVHSLGIVRSLGSEIAWEAGSDLYRYLPGEAHPELIYSAPTGSYIPDFVGSSAGYAIITQVTPKDYISFQWRLWYLHELGEVPVLVDAYDNEFMPLPTLAMDDKRLAWTRTRGNGDETVSELRIADLVALDEPQTLATYPFFDTNVEHPALHGDELWYGIRDNDWDAGTESPRVEMLDLAQPGAAPAVYGLDVRAFMPAVNDQVVVWKGGGVPQDSADNWGSLFVYWRSDDTVERIPDVGGGLDRVSYPSVGDRFVAWWDGNDQLYLYDLREHALRLVNDYDPQGGGLPASVAGSLLAFSYSAGEGEHLQLRWAILPQ